MCFSVSVAKSETVQSHWGQRLTGSFQSSRQVALWARCVATVPHASLLADCQSALWFPFCLCTLLSFSGNQSKRSKAEMTCTVFCPLYFLEKCLQMSWHKFFPNDCVGLCIWLRTSTVGQVWTHSTKWMEVPRSKRSKIASDRFSEIPGKVFTGRPVIIERKIVLTQLVEGLYGYTPLHHRKQPRSKRYSLVVVLGFLSVFHIKTSRSVLGVKGLVLQSCGWSIFLVSCSQKKRVNCNSQKTSLFHFHSNKKIKLTESQCCLFALCAPGCLTCSTRVRKQFCKLSPILFESLASNLIIFYYLTFCYCIL